MHRQWLDDLKRNSSSGPDIPATGSVVDRGAYLGVHSDIKVVDTDPEETIKMLEVRSRHLFAIAKVDRTAYLEHWSSVNLLCVASETRRDGVLRGADRSLPGTAISTSQRESETEEPRTMLLQQREAWETYPGIASRTCWQSLGRHDSRSRARWNHPGRS